MTARVVVIGLDAAEVDVIDELFDGKPPFENGGRSDDAAWCYLQNPMGVLPGALWNEIISGRSCKNQPFYYYPRQLRTGEAVPRPILEDDLDPNDFFWVSASQAGHRVAVLDAPYSTLYDKLNGVQLVEWGMHDPEYTTRSHPAGLLQDLLDRYGPHPVTAKAFGRCDRYKKTREGYGELLEDLCEGIRRRTAMYLDVLGREDWDLFFCTYSETHCAGHHFWHFHDPRHYLHEPDAPGPLKQAVRTVYGRTFASVRALIEAAGPDTTVLLFVPQGMQAFTGGQHMLPEILVRLGMGSDRGTANDSLLRRVQNKVRQHAPKNAYPLLRRVAGMSALKQVQGKVGGLLNPLESPNTRAVAVPNNRIGAIRLNIRGREPSGCIEPGEQAQAVLEELRSELTALRDPRNGEPIVKCVMTSDEAFGPDHHRDTPDLLVEFRTDMGPIEAARSDRIGTIRMPFGKQMNSRVGDHNTHARLWAKGAKITVRGAMPDASVVDIAPTVLQLLGVPPPNHFDGRILRLSV